MRSPDRRGFHRVGIARDALDLTGLWHGFYNYPIKKEPVPFTAQLTDMAGSLAGTTEETGSVGEAAGLTITASLQGLRSDSAVTLLKIYDRDVPLYDSVHYARRISEDGLEIEGRWTIQGHWSGTFLMIRAAAIAQTAETGVTVTA
jgi:hypothetical protein